MVVSARDIWEHPFGVKVAILRCVDRKRLKSKPRAERSRARGERRKDESTPFINNVDGSIDASRDHLFVGWGVNEVQLKVSCKQPRRRIYALLCGTLGCTGRHVEIFGTPLHSSSAAASRSASGLRRGRRSTRWATSLAPDEDDTGVVADSL